MTRRLGLPRAVDPVALVLGLGLIIVAGAVLGLATGELHRFQQPTAFALVLLFLLGVLLSPLNGVAVLYLVPPLFNGEDSQPYFYLLEMFVSLAVVAGFAAHLRGRRPLTLPHAPFLVLFLISTVISVPLNLKEAWLEVQVASWREILEDIRRSDLTANLFYVRTVVNVASGIAVCALVANQRWTREAVVRLAVAGTLLYVAVSLAGVWLYRFVTPSLGQFLALGLGWGELTGGFAGLGFNASYFAQYAFAYLPLAPLVLAERSPGWAKATALGALPLSVYTILHTNQRAAVIVLAVELGLLLLVGLTLRGETWSRARRIVTGAVAGTFAVLMFVLWFTPHGVRVLTRFRLLQEHGDSYRVQVLRAAWHMFRDQPLLGIGSGRFAQVFPHYDPDPALQFGSLSAHNLYAQFLAEQGALGLFSFLAILAVTLVPIVRAQRRLEGERLPVLFLLVSLGAWLTYGWLQYTFLMRSMQLYFWITLGLLVALTSQLVPPPRVSRRWVVAVLALVLVAVGLRAHAVVARPVRAGVALGVYGWEPGDVRWTRGGAVLVVAVEGKILKLAVAFPTLPILGHPQTVDVSLDGRPVQRVTLDTPEWKILQIPVAKPIGSTVLVRIGVDYTFVPRELGLNEDKRRLGVLMQRITWGGS